MTKTRLANVQIGSNEVEVNEWELKGPFLEQWTPDAHQASSPFERALDEIASERRISNRENMHCVARELGHFYLAHQGFPTGALKHYMQAACGALVSNVAIQLMHGEVPSTETDDAVFAFWNKNLKEYLTGLPAGGSAGSWFGRTGNKAVWILVSGKETVRLQPFSRRPNSQGALTLSGQFLSGVDRLSAMVTSGEWGFSNCVARPDFQLPQFEVNCPLGEGALAGLYSYEPGRILGHQAFEIYGWPDSGKFRYVRNTLKTQEEGTGTYTERMIRIINGVRARLSRSPLRHSETQSVMSSLLAPHFFAKNEVNTPEKSTEYTKEDLVALSVMAGWKVNENIVNGDFLGTYTLSQEHPHRLLEDLLRSAASRQTLLDPAKDVIAVGLHSSGGLGALISTYETAKPFQHEATVELILKNLNREREKRGHSPAKWVTSPPDGDKQVAQLLKQSKEPPMKILDAFMEKISAYSGSGRIRRKTNWQTSV